MMGEWKPYNTTALIQIEFRGLPLTIDVDLLLLEQIVPSNLSMQDMVQNGLDISVVRAHITYGRRA